VEAGSGGNGCVSFLREKFRPYGGPDGGCGGDGGDVIIIADKQLHTLLDLKIRHVFRAGRGKHGQGKNKTGRRGANRIVRVPCGTIVCDRTTREVIVDLIEHEQKAVVAFGGKGGKGNMSFAGSTDRAPRKALPGEPGESRWLYLELKLLADIGIVGLPNAGKSSLISKISAAHPKIAPYPFTTLTPYLGAIEFEGDKTLIMADIPGLIEGAHQGQGLGDRFLRHVERSKILLHMIDIATPFHGDPVQDFEVIESELEQCGRSLDEKPRIIALNKIDCSGTEKNRELLKKHLKDKQMTVFEVSALTGEGLKPLLLCLYDIFRGNRNL